MPPSYAESSTRRRFSRMSSQPAFDDSELGPHSSIWDEPSVLQAWTSYRQRQAVLTS